jgi:hypothetical protein
MIMGCTAASCNYHVRTRVEPDVRLFSAATVEFCLRIFALFGILELPIWKRSVDAIVGVSDQRQCALPIRQAVPLGCCIVHAAVRQKGGGNLNRKTNTIMSQFSCSRSCAIATKLKSSRLLIQILVLRSIWHPPFSYCSLSGGISQMLLVFE